MQIVIDIDDNLYTRLFDSGVDYVMDMRRACAAIRNGKPLPKGHGRLIDYGYVVDAIDDWVNSGEYNYTNATDYLRNRIRNVPTVIEADKGE